MFQYWCVVWIEVNAIMWIAQITVTCKLTIWMLLTLFIYTYETEKMIFFPRKISQKSISFPFLLVTRVFVSIIQSVQHSAILNTNHFDKTDFIHAKSFRIDGIECYRHSVELELLKTSGCAEILATDLDFRHFFYIIIRNLNGWAASSIDDQLVVFGR